MKNMDWDRLYNCAKKAVNPKKISEYIFIGGVQRNLL